MPATAVPVEPTSSSCPSRLLALAETDRERGAPNPPACPVATRESCTLPTFVQRSDASQSNAVVRRPRAQPRRGHLRFLGRR